MGLIITITFNPAVDKSTSVKELIPEKKLDCHMPLFEPGGGGINVARALKKLGQDAKAIYLAGGATGGKLTSLLIDEGIEPLIIEIGESTRENFIVVESISNKQYRFGMPGPIVTGLECEKCLETLQNLPDVAYIIASGSLPSGVPPDIFSKIAQIAREKNARLIIDTSGEPLKRAVQAGVYLIKPNLKELASLVGKDEITVEMVETVAKELIATGKCEIVVVSKGAKGAVLITKDQTIQVIPPAVELKSTVGAGDSMVAGMVLSLANQNSLLKTLQFGVACGTAATMNPGTELCRKKDAEYLFHLIQNGDSA